jgi:uncharacterized oligopeptide transporter (OPT) family protein
MFIRGQDKLASRTATGKNRGAEFSLCHLSRFVMLRGSQLPAMSSTPTRQTGFRRFLPPIGTPRYHLLLGAVAIFILGPLGGISAAYMNFSLGFFVGGQVLAGILGSVVTYGYGAEGKHGANYMQTMAASVAGLAGLAVLIQAMVWLGLPEPPVWQLVLYFTCIGMFGVGVGMLYTPILVDRMQLVYPSGFAVANILRALTNPTLLKRSVGKLGGGIAGGFASGLAVFKVPAIEPLGLNVSTIGAGMVVGARIAVPGFVIGVLGYYLTPYLRTIGWLGEKDPFRKIGFILALGTILGAAIVDITLIGYQAIQRLRQVSKEPAPAAPDWKRVNVVMLVVWVIGWALGLVFVGSQVLHQPVLFVALAVGLTFLFVLVNGISTGISDWNPISSAFVVSVFIMAAAGLTDAGVGLMCASILLITCGVGVDMQQDRSTGWRLGTNRRNQFRYQVIGVAMGAILAVALAKVFMSAYPVLRIDSFSNPNVEGAKQWQSAMTYKFVGALKGLTNPAPHLMKALLIGIGIGLLTEVLRKLLKNNPRYQTWARNSRAGAITDFSVDAVVLPSPYASSFGGFVELLTTVWFALGGVVGSILNGLTERRRARALTPAEGEVPADMSTTSLIGGGLIAGDSLAALSIGIYGLLKTLL